MSRLHVLIAVIVLGLGGYVYYQQKQAAPETATPTKPLRPSTANRAGQTPPNPTPSASPAPTVKNIQDVYTVSRGETLWAIARDHSPAKSGPGWVGIWKANQSAIKDFDNLEEGLSLTIPQERRAYITRFWKPRHFDVAERPQPVDLAELFRAVPAVDLAELPQKGLDLEVNVAELPVPEDSQDYGFAVSAVRPALLPIVSYR